MSWLLLLGATLLLLVLPLWPALAEWRRPQDTAPLPIDRDDGLDPAYHARQHLTQLAAALSRGERQLGAREIVDLPAPWVWPLSDPELRQQRTQRIWRSPGDLMLPRGMRFDAEVVAGGHLHTAPHGRHHALAAGRRLVLAERSSVSHWVHAEEVQVGAGSRLGGRATASRRIAVGADVGFDMLHAPEVRFEPPAPPRVPRAALLPLPPAHRWDVHTGRALYCEPVAIGEGHGWQGDIVSHGAIDIGPGCAASGSLKALGDLRLGEDCAVSGSVMAGGRVVLGAGCRVGGPVVSETAIELGPGCTVGAPQRPATVAAPRITVAPGVVVHGTVWAGEEGRTAA